MKKLRRFLILLAILSGNRCIAQNPRDLLWMQQPAISPDGQWIAFEYKGNIFKVKASGGTAIPLTMNNWYNGYPKWSHDGSQLAFASDRYGNFDVFTMPAAGGTATRLTYASTRDIPTDFSGDGKLIYYMTNAPDVYTSVRFPDPDNLWQKLYEVPVKGGRAHLVNSAGTEFASFNNAGDKLIFQDRKGWENPYRKHQISPVTRDIWCYDMKSNAYTRLTDFAGEDREPVWGAGDQFYYLSERSGNQNIFTASLVAPEKVKQLTGFEKDPVRNLSISGNGLLAFTQKGELYTLKEGEPPQKLTVTFDADFGDEQFSNVSVKSAGDEMSVSPNGSEIAFIFQGDIFVTNSAGTITRQITHTPEEERMVSFSPDGRTLLYSVENPGSWDIYQATLDDPAETSFYGTSKINISAVIASGKDEYQGVFSPDGKRIAYMEERSLLKVYDVASKETLTLVPAGATFSFKDGDMPFCWSSDGKYIAFQTENGLQGRVDVDLVKTDGTEKAKNVTLGAYLNWQPHWGSSGRMIYYMANKEGSGGGQRDVYALFFDHTAFKHYVKSAEDPLLQAEKKRLDSLTRPAKEKADANRNIIPNTLHPEDETVKLTSFSSQLGGFVLSPDEQKLYTISTVGENSGIWVFNQQTHESSVLSKLENGGGELEISNDGKFLYLLSGGKLTKINTADGQNSPIRIDGNAFLNKSDQRKYILEHVYHLLAKKFYDPKLRGIDWAYYYSNYSRFLPHINNNYDFELLLSEMLGELNSSHSGAGFRPSNNGGDQTGALGLLYDLGSTEPGLKVMAVLPGGPFDLSDNRLKSGDFIDEIDGNQIANDVEWSRFLNLKVGKSVLVAFHDPVSKKHYEEIVKPVSLAEEKGSLLYRRWVREMEHITDSLSHGTIAYVHIPEMNDESLRATYEAAIGRGSAKKAVIFDTRYNTGGNIHESLMRMITGSNSVLYSRPQGTWLINEGTSDGLNKPSCVIVSEGNYSDGYNFPYVYQLNRAGKLIGTSVAGTGTGVFYEPQVDRSLFIGIPQIGLSLDGADKPLLENHQINPDVFVRNEYSQVLNGRDQQLEAAIAVLMDQIKKQ